jgi:hypothetical protein
LLARAIQAASRERVEQIAKDIGSHFSLKPSGWGEMLIDSNKPAVASAEKLGELADLIAQGWRARTQAETQKEANAQAAIAP